MQCDNTQNELNNLHVLSSKHVKLDSSVYIFGMFGV